MKRTVSAIILMMLLFGMITLAFNVQPVKASGTIYINADGSISPPTAPISISDKITYTLTDNINGSIVVERDNIVIDGNGHMIQGTGTETGIDLSGRSNVTIKNMEIQEFGEGIRMLDSSNNSIIENNFWDDGDRGIWLYGSSNNNISRNNVINNDYGIWLEYSSNNNSIIGNNVTANTYDGILLDHSSNNNDVFENNAEKNFPGIMIDHSSNNNIVRNNVTSNHDGIRFFYSSNNSIIGNNVTANQFYGITLDGPSSNNVLRDNAMARNGYSFGVWGYELADFINDVDTSNTVDEKPIYYLVNVQNLIIDPQAYPDIGYLAVVNSTNVTVRNLDIKNNLEGVLLACTRNSSIENFTVTNNSAGLLLVCSSNNSIAGNNITNNYWGIVLWESSYNSISGNNITNNYWGYGIWLYESSSYNSISGNNFINNALQASVTTGYTNFWDDGYPSGGNFWSDYAGVDANGDGIGDTPYVIDADNQDRYPLMHPWSPLPVHNINTGLGYTTIQEAINAANLGDTIYAKAGTYYENVVVNKTLSLIGENRDTTIVDGGRKGHVIQIVADNVTIHEFTITHSGSERSGIYIDRYRGLVDLQGNNIIRDNITTGNYQGIHVCSDNNVISNNKVVLNSDFGIYVQSITGARYNTISNNTITHNYNGIIIEWHNNVIVHNSIANNRQDGILITGISSYNTVSQNKHLKCIRWYFHNRRLHARAKQYHH